MFGLVVKVVKNAWSFYQLCFCMLDKEKQKVGFIARTKWGSAPALGVKVTSTTSSFSLLSHPLLFCLLLAFIPSTFNIHFNNFGKHKYTHEMHQGKNSFIPHHLYIQIFLLFPFNSHLLELNFLLFEIMS